MGASAVECCDEGAPRGAEGQRALSDVEARRSLSRFVGSQPILQVPGLLAPYSERTIS